MHTLDQICELFNYGDAEPQLHSIAIDPMKSHYKKLRTHSYPVCESHKHGSQKIDHGHIHIVIEDKLAPDDGQFLHVMWTNVADGHTYHHRTGQLSEAFAIDVDMGKSNTLYKGLSKTGVWAGTTNLIPEEDPAQAREIYKTINQAIALAHRHAFSP